MALIVKYVCICRYRAHFNILDIYLAHMAFLFVKLLANTIPSAKYTYAMLFGAKFMYGMF